MRGCKCHKYCWFVCLYREVVGWNEELLKSQILLVDMFALGGCWLIWGVGGREGGRLQRSHRWIQRNAAGPESLPTHILCCRTFIFALGVSFLFLRWLVRAEVSRRGLWNVSEESIVWKPALCILGSFPSKLPWHCYHWTIMMMMILMLMMMVKLSFCPRMRTTSTLTRRESITTFTSLHMFSSRRCYDEENIRG